MIVRTYGRRNRGIARTYSDGLNDVVEDPYKDSLSQESPHELYGLAFSSQDSSHWSFDSDPYGDNSLPPRESENGVVRKAKKARNGKRQLGGVKNSKPMIPAVAATATLMETQEFGEMMEHVDEVNFALDGLRKGQPLRIRRASLLSLLSICGTAQQRRLLRTQGYVNLEFSVGDIFFIFLSIDSSCLSNLLFFRFGCYLWVILAFKKLP